MKFLHSSIMHGNNVSHAKNRTKKAFHLNKIKASFFSELLNNKIHLTVTASIVRDIHKLNGIDNYILKNGKNFTDKNLRIYKTIKKLNSQK